MAPKERFAGMICIDDEAFCYNNAGSTGLDYKCSAAAPICVKEDGSEPALHSPGDKCIQRIESSPWHVYASEDDFNGDNTVHVNVVALPGRLILKSERIISKYIWVPESALGTVVRIKIETGEIVGRYKTWPDSYGVGGSNPKGVSVDRDGTLWVANNNDYNGNGTITHIGLEETGLCEDRNGNGIIETSSGLSDLKAWADDSGTHGVATADDECITHFVSVSSSKSFYISVNRDNDVWVSGYDRPNFDLVKGGRYDMADSGTIIETYPSIGFGGYPGLIDGNNYLWSSRLNHGLLRWSTNYPLAGTNGSPGGLDVGPPYYSGWGANSDVGSYGLCKERVGNNIWNTNFRTSGEIKRFASLGNYDTNFSTGGDYPIGCVFSPGTDDLWIANSGSNTVAHLKSNGTLLGTIPVGTTPTAVSVDRFGQIWVCNAGSHNVNRIDPSLNNGVGGVNLTIPLSPNAGPYSMSDMTGVTSDTTSERPPMTGTWTVTHDSGIVGQKWGYVTWFAALDYGAAINVQARSSTDGISHSAWESVTQFVDLTVPNGRYLQVRVRLGSSGTTPVLCSLSILPA